jgi:hypothetical protein
MKALSLAENMTPKPGPVKWGNREKIIREKLLTIFL